MFTFIYIHLYVHILDAAPACLFRVSVRFSERLPKLSGLFLKSSILLIRKFQDISKFVRTISKRIRQCSELISKSLT